LAKTRTSRKKTRKPAGDGGELFVSGNGNGDGQSPDAPSRGGGGGSIEPIALHEAARVRYLNYSLSVITSRALPDVRDGLKPVQRRILYTMWQQGLRSDAKPRKSATVCGAVMGNYHPHGDQAIYDALVRMAQAWVMRLPLIDGHGNFGSQDDDPPAAMRYTECRLAPVADELLSDIGRGTVDSRPNFDGTKTEPVVLPARLPNLLINGSAGIAVGMATNIPPHNPAEVLAALLKLLADPEVTTSRLVANDAIRGPDFPTGGQLINSKKDLQAIYNSGTGPLRIRATVEDGDLSRSAQTLLITAIPYGVNKATLVTQIADIVLARKLPLLLDVKDLSTDEVRIELSIRRDAEPQKVLAYLYKHTQLQTSFNVNLTCLVPTSNPQVAAPLGPAKQPGDEGIDLKQVLWHFLHFRLEVVTRRLEHELEGLRKRIHILDGFALIFDALDEIIKIIRRSDGKADAAVKIMKRFEQLDEVQTDAILELKLYRLAKLEINLVRDELDTKRTRADQIDKLLAEDADVSNTQTSGRWGIVREELEALRDQMKDTQPRRTVLETVEDEPEYSAEDFIIDEDAVVVLTADGWIKRQKEVKDPSAMRLRDGDRLLALLPASTRSTVALLSGRGVCYTARVQDIPATTGYGEPVQKLFKLGDGEQIIAAVSLDKRHVGDITGEAGSEEPPPVHAVAATSDGYALRFSLNGFAEPSTRSGRKYARPAKGAEVVGAQVVTGEEVILAASERCRAMVTPVDEINYLAGPGKGVILIKLAKDDRLLGFKASTGDRDLLTIETNRGATKTISTAKYQPTGRGGKGIEVQKNGRIERIVPEDVELPAMAD
jgi:DNA gyrase subunit A